MVFTATRKTVKTIVYMDAWNKGEQKRPIKWILLLMCFLNRNKYSDQDLIPINYVRVNNVSDFNGFVKFCQNMMDFQTQINM